MRTYLRAGLVVLLATLTVAALVPPSGAAGGYEVTVNRTSLRPGQVLTATTTAPIRCDWTLTWNGVLRHGTGRTFTASWTAPEVRRKTRLPLRARCFHAPERRPAAPPTTVAGSASQRITVTVPASTDRSVVVTVLPRVAVVAPPGVDGTPGLPNTGGPPLWLLFAALGAAFLGSVLVLADGRQRRTV